VIADRGYDHARLVREHGIKPDIARRQTEPGSGLGRGPGSSEVEPLDVSLDELLAVPQPAWAVWPAHRIRRRRARRKAEASAGASAR
jgi:hypothetical protein